MRMHVGVAGRLVARRIAAMVAVRAVAIAVSLAGMCLAAVYAHAETTVGKIRRTNTLVIAYLDQQFPFSARSEDGQPYGYSIDLCRHIAEAVRRELKLPQLQVRYRLVDASSRFDAVARGDADIECGATTNNAARRAQFAFTIPHFITSTRMIVRKSSGIHDWSELRDKRVVLVRGSSIIPYVRAFDATGMLRMQLLETDKESEALSMLVNGEVDAYADDEALLHAFRNDMEDGAAFAIEGEALSVDAYAMMMRKDAAAFKTIVDREMARMIFDGDIYAIYDRWFMQPVGPDRRSLNVPMSYLLRDSFHFPSDKVMQ